MKKYLLILAISVLPKASSAQITINNVSFTATSDPAPLAFVYNNIDELLSQKVLPGAIRLDLCIGNTGCNVTAQLISNSFPTGAPVDWLSQTWTHDSSPDAVNISINTSLPPFVEMPLFTQPTAGTYSYYYNLNLSPVANFIPSGLYSFTIRYTMALP